MLDSVYADRRQRLLSRLEVSGDDHQLWTGAPGSATEDEFGLYDIVVDPGGSTVTTHYRTTFSESFYILETRIDLHLDGRVVATRPGDFAYAPRESPHGSPTPPTSRREC